MLHAINLENILFLDIETVPEVENFSDLDQDFQELFAHKTQYQRKDEVPPEAFYERAGIWAEFGKIICISVGYFTQKQGERQFRVTTFQGDEERLLIDFSNLVTNHFSLPHHLMCGHNVKEFDFPFIARRMLIHGIKIPSKLNLMGKKPWEVPHLDTLELWKFGDYKHFTSLKLLTKVLGVPSPKDDIDGSEVAKVFYKDKDIDRIAIYCEKDVIAVAQIILKLKLQKLLTDDEILKV
ncbi:3'-5' exonuclease [Flavobacterium difficile]|uniref:3'-5' exonuclease n=1 Tax=Flavobacterium difficile TaxID=2709659 RepID=A0ABX0I5C8_9FLAO|nr:3'-5' exonuclease [Flavobacterium difficile]NHM02394.1 3'-5' exonuclease [Flavobacterium difficile]